MLRWRKKRKLSRKKLGKTLGIILLRDIQESMKKDLRLSRSILQSTNVLSNSDLETLTNLILIRIELQLLDRYSQIQMNCKRELLPLKAEQEEVRKMKTWRVCSMEMRLMISLLVSKTKCSLK